MKFRRVNASLMAAVMAVTSVVVAVPASAEVGAWTDSGDGSYSYTQGDDASAAIPNLDILSCKPENTAWADVNYVSVDVTGTDKVQSVIGGEVGGNWAYGQSITKDGAGTATIYLETGGAEVTTLGLEFWQIADNVVVNAGTEITVDNIQFLDGEMPDPIGAWYQDDAGAWCYTNDEYVDYHQGLDLLKYATDNSKDWATTKYVSAKVESDGTAKVNINANFTGTDDGCRNSVEKEINADNSAVIRMATNGVTPQGVGINFNGDESSSVAALAANQSVKISEIEFHDSFDGLVESWYEKSENTYGYTHGEDNTAAVAEFALDISGVTDWSTIKYISVDVEATATTNPVIGGDFGTDDWRNGSAVWMDGGGTSTVYFKCNGDTPQRMAVQFWTDTFDAGAEITLSNITISDQEMPDPIGSWYEEDSAWYYQNGDTAINYAGLDLMQFASEESVDWSTVKYISATVETEGTIYAAIDVNYTDNDDNWEDSPTRTASGTPLTLYFNTDGKTPVSANVSIRADMYDVALTANQLVKVSNIVFSTEERDYTGVTGEWYKQDNKWHYTHGDDPSVVVCECVFDISSVEDWSAIKYVSVDVEATATTQPIICGVYAGDEWINGDPVWMEGGGTATAYYACNGDTPESVLMQFWTETFDAGAEITLSNITFSTEEMPDPVGVWFEKNDVWYYQNGDTPAKGQYFNLVEYAKDNNIDWSKVKYVSAKAYTAGTAIVGVNANYTGNDEDWVDGTTTPIDNSTTVIALATNGKTPIDCGLNYFEDPVTELALAANQLAQFSEIEFHESYDGIVNAWYEQNGTYTYKTYEDTEYLKLDLVKIAAEKNVDWSKVKYVSVDIESDGEAHGAFAINYAGEEDWFSSSSHDVDNTKATVSHITDGAIPATLEIGFHGDGSSIGLKANQTVKVSNIVFSETLDGLVSCWYEQDGAWYYKNDNNLDNWIPLNIKPIAEANKVDWSKVKYVSATVESAGTVIPGFDVNYTGGEADSDWTNGDDAVMENGKGIAYYITDDSGTEPKVMELAMRYNDSVGGSLANGQLVKVTNIEFHDSYDGLTDAWFEIEDGVWSYTASKDTDDVGTNFYADNWDEIRYVSADVEVDGEFEKMRLNADTGANVSKDGKYAFESTTLYVDTFGKEYDNVNFFAFGVKAGTTITISNVKFSTEARDFSKVFDEWYQIGEDAFEYKASTSDIEDPDDVFFDECISLSGAKYYTADITVDGTMTGVLTVNDDEFNTTKIGQALTLTDTSSTMYIFCDEGGWVHSSFDLWKIEEGSKVTVSNIKVYNDYIKDYKGIVGQWVQIGEDDYYYSHKGLPTGYGAELPLTPMGYDISDVQTISMKIKHVLGEGGESWYGAKVHVSGVTNGDYHPGYVFNSSIDEQLIVRKYRGMLESEPKLEITYIDPDLEVYVTDLTFSTETVAAVTSTPNDVIVDENESVIGDYAGNWTGAHAVMWFDLAKIELEGTLKIDVELVDNKNDEHWIDPVWSDWSGTAENGWLHVFGTHDKPGKQLTENCTIEIPITADIIKMIHETASHQCELNVAGTGIKVSNFIFTPKSDVPEPEVEEFKPDTLPEEEKKVFEEKLEESKKNTVDEKDAKDHVHNKKPQGHRQYKKNKHGKDVYALRIVQMVDKELLKHAKDVTITVYSKKANKYVTFTAECCFSYLNINGEKVKAGGNHAFLTVIIDNVHADDEITFTDFTINYKK